MVGMTSNDAPTQHGMLDVGDGQNIYWEQWGPSDGVPAVCLHGGPGGTLNASQFRRHFDLSRVRAIGFEQRGCGRSTPHASDPSTSLSTNTTAHLIADIEALREHLGVEAWIVNGVSWGSTLAVAYALAHPTRVLGVVLFAVTTTCREEVDWITEGVGAVFPKRGIVSLPSPSRPALAIGAGTADWSTRTTVCWIRLISRCVTVHPENGHCGRTSTSRSAPAVSDAIPGGRMTGSDWPSYGWPRITGRTTGSAIRLCSIAPQVCAISRAS